MVSVQAVTTTHFITVGAGQNGANLQNGGQNAATRVPLNLRDCHDGSTKPLILLAAMYV